MCTSPTSANSLTQSSCQVVALTGGGIPAQLSLRSSSRERNGGEGGGEGEGRE